MTDTAARAQAFIKKWDAVTVNERAVAQSHFNDLCTLLGVPPPLEVDPTGSFFRFEKPLSKAGGGKGFADVWHQDRFAWEYKTKGKYPDLRAAYQQLTLYRADLDNPPILVACDIANYEVHIEFTGYTSRVVGFQNADLQNVQTRELLRLALTAPEQLRPIEQQATITEKAAAQLARVAGFLEKRGFAPIQVAHFFMKILFALFAEDIHILPGELMSQGIKRAIFKPEEFVGRTRALFRAMKVGDYFGEERVPQFNGWLFDDEEILALNADELTFLSDAARLDWSQVEPAIFGTLFERSLDPNKRAQLGAHYTSKDDILLIVEPVLMAPLRREWEDAKTGVEALRAQWESEHIGVNRQRQLKGVAEGILLDFMERLSTLRVLDPASGSGNFLYVALTELKNLEKQVWSYAGGVGLPQPALSVSPKQLFGIEKNAFAAELAQVVVWIGYLQWNQANGFFDIHEPILQTLHNIQCRDAILTVDLHGQPAEPEWPEADVIVGNPPFIGGSKLRRELGGTYTESLWKLYDDRVPGGADLVTYWFERARELIEAGQVHRAGLLATQSIRGGSNRKVLERIKHTSDIFMAWSDRDWIQDGVAVHVSMVGFGESYGVPRVLDGRIVQNINADLTAMSDLTAVSSLVENQRLGFRGNQKGGPFDIPGDIARAMLLKENTGGRNNANVVRRWFNGLDVMRKPRDMWIIDFGTNMPIEEAQKYEAPFDYVQRHVYPTRKGNNRRAYAERWWIHMEARPSMRAAIKPLTRYIVTPHVTKHRAFAWLDGTIIPDHQLVVFARDDDYFFGVLHSKVHELWSLGTGTQLREVESGFRYTPTTCFETFAFPWPPGTEPQGDPRVQAIAEAARELVRLRDEWLAGDDDRPPTIDDRSGNRATLQSSVVSRRSSSDRTLTNLYNRHPDWLAEAHRRLDAAVFDAYGWPPGLSDDEILARLLALNLARAAGQAATAAGVVETLEQAEDDE